MVFRRWANSSSYIIISRITLLTKTTLVRESNLLICVPDKLSSLIFGSMLQMSAYLSGPVECLRFDAFCLRVLLSQLIDVGDLINLRLVIIAVSCSFKFICIDRFAFTFFERRIWQLPLISLCSALNFNSMRGFNWLRNHNCWLLNIIGAYNNLIASRNLFDFLCTVFMT